MCTDHINKKQCRNYKFTYLLDERKYCVVTVMTAKKYHKGEQKRNRGNPLHNEERRGKSERNVITDNFCVHKNSHRLL
jgi:hypothetical protein